MIQESSSKDVNLIECLGILEDNLKKMYEQTIGWDSDFKLSELSQPQMKYYIIRDVSGIDAFCSFTEEYGTEVEDAWIIYCYELQVKREFQGKGLGGLLMEKLEEQARTLGAKKIMLTCFNINTAAMQFYSKRGYKADESSPEGNVPYRILSFLIN